MKSLVCQRNRHRKVFNRGFYMCAVGLDILKFEQTLLFYNAPYFNWGGLELCFGEGKRTKAPPPPWRRESCKTSACFFMHLNQKSTLATWYVKLARYAKLSVYKHDRAQSCVATSRLALRWMVDSTRTKCARRITPIYMWHEQAIIECSQWSDHGERPLMIFMKLVNSW